MRSFAMMLVPICMAVAGCGQSSQSSSSIDPFCENASISGSSTAVPENGYRQPVQYAYGPVPAQLISNGMYKVISAHREKAYNWCIATIFVEGTIGGNSWRGQMKVTATRWDLVGTAK